MVKDQDDNLVTELEGVATVWKDYCRSLYADPNALIGDLGDYEKEPEILLEEVQIAIDLNRSLVKHRALTKFQLRSCRRWMKGGKKSCTCCARKSGIQAYGQMTGLLQLCSPFSKKVPLRFATITG